MHHRTSPHQPCIFSSYPGAFAQAATLSRSFCFSDAPVVCVCGVAAARLVPYQMPQFRPHSSLSKQMQKNPAVPFRTLQQPTAIPSAWSLPCSKVHSHRYPDRCVVSLPPPRPSWAPQSPPRSQHTKLRLSPILHDHPTSPAVYSLTASVDFIRVHSSQQYSQLASLCTND